MAFRCLWVAGSAVAMATLPLPSILETSTRQRGSEQKAAQVLRAQPAVEGHSFSTSLGPCWTKQQYLGLAVLQCRSCGNEARVRGMKEQRVAARESRQEHLVTEVKTSLPDRVGCLLPGETRDFLPTSQPKG